MHSYHNKLLPNHFHEYFIPISSIHSHSTRLAASNNLFLPRVNSSSGKCSLTFIGRKVWCSIPNDIKSSTTFTFKWKLKNTSYMIKIHNYELLQHFTYPEPHSVNSVFCNSVYFVYVYFSHFFFPVHIPFFSA